MPAFVGLGAPYWDAEARGALLGLTRNSGPAEIAQAAFEAVGYQTRDLLEAMHADWPTRVDIVLRVDGNCCFRGRVEQFQCLDYGSLSATVAADQPGPVTEFDRRLSDGSVIKNLGAFEPH
ncbi:protein of unknown function [Hyphomicrobium sp. MC1]|nr:protein of unknown function [Hyphomicrobium sp. MC1]